MRVIEAWENPVNVVAEKKLCEKMIRCGTSVNWWENELREAGKRVERERETHKQHASDESVVTWGTSTEPGGTNERHVGKKKKGIWDELHTVQNVNNDCEGGVDRRGVDRRGKGLTGWYKRAGKGEV